MNELRLNDNPCNKVSTEKYINKFFLKRQSPGGIYKFFSEKTIGFLAGDFSFSFNGEMGAIRGILNGDKYEEEFFFDFR